MIKKEELLPLGVMTSLGDDPLQTFRKIRELGLSTCQLNNPPYEYVYGKDRAALTQKVREAIAETQMKVSSVFIMYKGHIWDLIDGPRTIGLIPEDTRAERAVHACMISNWAKKVDIPVVTSHMGFIPVDAGSELYKGFIKVLKLFVAFCADNGQTFAFETGQEPPRVLRRAIDDIGMDNVGVNLDPANLLLYGMGTPLEGVEAFGDFVVNTHCKDGRRPEPGGKLGVEMPLGEGDVHFETLIPALYRKGYRGPLTIEREITGQRQIADILRAKKILEGIKDNLPPEEKT